MLILFIIYFLINFDFVLVYYTDDGSLELGSETSGLVLYNGNVLIGKVNNGAMALLVVYIQRFITKLRFPQSESILQHRKYKCSEKTIIVRKLIKYKMDI